MIGGKKHLCQVLGLLLLSLSVFGLTVSVRTPGVPIALPRCQDRCGDVEIPYPFGIGEGCYRNTSYEIRCNQTADSSIPVLKIINNEVMSISISDGYSDGNVSSIRVRGGKIFSSGCNHKSHDDNLLLNLTGHPFVFLRDIGIVAVGCNADVSLTLANQQSLHSSSGCNSSCNATEYPGRNAAENACRGFRCCAARLPFAETYFVDLEPKEQNARGCNFAFLTDELWTPRNATENEILKRDYMPITLIWYSFPMSKPGNDSSFGCDSFLSGGFVRAYCWCESGFRGNPYLPNGCRDVDECKEAKDKGENLCGKNVCVNISGSYECHVKQTWPIILGTSLGFGILVVVGGAWWVHKYLQKQKVIRRTRRNFELNGGLLLQQRLYSVDHRLDCIKVFSSKEVEMATDHFNENRILGCGGQSTVYKGMLDDGTIVAVKKAKLVDADNVEDFINEIIILSQINHRHVVKLLGCCLEIEVPILVYEFIANGNLFQHIHSQLEGPFMGWDFRLNIASEAANAICHLHSSIATPVYHRDIKSTNILLDERYKAKVSDFGISRAVTIDQTHITTIISGTLGYIDPEFLQSGHFTDRSDVYSFGVVLVELLTGEKPLSSTRPDEKRILSNHFIMAMKGNCLFDIIDAKIKDQCNQEEVMAVANLAMNCLNSEGINRPTMKEVSSELDRLLLQRNNSYALMENDFSNGCLHEEQLHIDYSKATTFSITSSLTRCGSGSDSEPLAFTIIKY